MTTWTVARQGSSVHGIVPARTPNWDALPPPRDLPKQGWNLHLMWLSHCGGYFTTQPLGKPPKPKHLWSNNLTRLPRPFALAQTHWGRPQTTSTRLYARGELQGSPVRQALAGHKRRIPLAVVLPRPARGAGTLIPSAQRLIWAAKQVLGKAALGALFA